MSAQECVFCCCSSPCIHGRRHSAVVSLRACVLFVKRCVRSGGLSSVTVGAGLVPVGAALPDLSPASSFSEELSLGHTAMHRRGAGKEG